MIKGKAIVITGGLLDSNHAKTAHGLIRGSERFEVVAVIDDKCNKKDAGEVLDGKNRGIPLFKSVREYLAAEIPASYAIIGVATKGGVIPDSMKSELKQCMTAGMSIVNGLHEHLSSIQELSDLATDWGVSLIDIRKSKPFGEARFWNGDIIKVKCPKIAVLGTDCALGKRTTTRFITEALKNAGHKAEMIYTGQTGWMQGAKYGFIFDATVNDFISGEIEGAVLECWEKENPDIIIIEGQSSLRNPSGPCGSEFIISARLDGVILQHNPTRVHYKDMEYYPDLVASPAEEVKLIKMFGADTLAITLNTKGMEAAEAKQYASALESELGIPVILPIEEGMSRLIEICERLIK